uniref:Synaptobrevin domain containing protein n=1 Tax=Haemonchus contortus TaxID=6289 RepID=W6NFA0_HAECO
MENFKLPVSKIGCEDKIMQTRRQLDEVMDMMRSNIEKLSERSERLEDLACRAEVLDMASNEFQRCATEVRRKKMWKAYAAKAVVIGLACAAIISTVGYFAL